ncbi:HNH endonuclease signature motif containing protein, partial [Pseudoclavibacter helvolus]|uniref:HNH endonuclease signature motif containing protein n=1 Tax=Pseudoclavibacter helvolus TaxID=255205 RepID=UPI000A4339EF
DSRVLPPKALRMAAARVAESLTEESVSERHERARKTRYVSVTATENGMCLLRARLPLIEGKAIADRLRKQGKALIKARPKPANAKPTGTNATSRPCGPGADDVADAEAEADAPDERTMDEVKADLFADMLLTSDPMSCAAAAGIQASVQFTIPILTALTKLGGSGAGSSASASRVGGATRLTPAPALLDGMIPIPLEDAIRLAGTATSFVRILTHPITGTVEAVDTYRPTAGMRAYLTARDIHCRWPGCRQPAATCDLDHTHAWEHDGTTTLENLCGLCRHHHVMKHATAWTATQLPGGVMQLRTPSGKTITDRPEHHDVHFTPNDENLGPLEPSSWSSGASPPAAEPSKRSAADDAPF